MHRTLILALSLCLFVVAPADGADRLNILFLTADDMNCDSVGVFGAPIKGITPNLDRLAGEGLRFEHGHVTIAICQPTRAVWMTGRYPHNSGAFGFDKIKPGIPTLPETLKADGYITGILGKTEHVIPSRTEAFDYRRGRHEMANGRSGDKYGAFASEFLAQSKASGKPFFFMVNMHDPHRPFDSLVPASQRKAAAPPAEDAKKKKGKKTKKQRGGAYPAPSKIYGPKEIVIPGFLPDLPKIRHEIAQYYSSVRRCDDIVGVVLKALDESGYRDNTLVMFKSDHGIAVPFAKTNVWRHSTRSPWIVRWPGVVKAGAHDTEHLVAGVDLAPTLLEAAGVSPMQGMDGRSFLPVLKGQAQDGWTDVFTHINTIASKRRYTMRSIQDKRYGYIWNGWSDGQMAFKNESQAGFTFKAMVEGAKTSPQIAARVKHFVYRVPEEFYDYQADPDARRNLINDPAAAGKIKAFRARLRDRMRATGDPFLKDFEKSAGF